MKIMQFWKNKVVFRCRYAEPSGQWLVTFSSMKRIVSSAVDNSAFVFQSHAMHRAAVSVLLSLTLAVTASAAPRFAAVRIVDIYGKLESTVSRQKELQKEQTEILKDERAEQLRRMLTELQDLQAQLQAKRNSPVDDATRKLARDFEIKRQETQTLQQEFETFRAEKTKEINRRLVLAMRASLDKIAATSNRLAKEQGFDAAFDSSGKSNTGVPILLYAKNAKDITEDVVAALKDAGEPTVAAEGAATPEAPAPADPNGPVIPKP